MKIKAIFLDLGGTLVHTSLSNENEELKKIRSAAFRDAGYEISEKKMKKVFCKVGDYVQKKLRGDYRRHKIGLWLSLAFKMLNLPVDEKIIREYGIKVKDLEVETSRMIDNAFDLLSFLKKKGYKLVLTSNGSNYGVNRIVDKHGFRKFFDLIIISEDIHAEKSTTIPYKLALKKLNLKPEEVIVVGDRIDEDILGANKLGIKSVRVKFGFEHGNDIPGVKPDFVIDDLMKLKKVLEQINHG